MKIEERIIAEIKKNWHPQGYSINDLGIAIEKPSGKIILEGAGRRSKQEEMDGIGLPYARSYVTRLAKQGEISPEDNVYIFEVIKQTLPDAKIVEIEVLERSTKSEVEQ